MATDDTATAWQNILPTIPPVPGSPVRERPHTRWVFSIPVSDEVLAALHTGLTAAGFDVHLMREEWGPESRRAVRVYERSGTAEVLVEICEWFAFRKWDQ